MELDACEALADYSLQEAPFYEANPKYIVYSMSSSTTTVKSSLKCDEYKIKKNRKCVSFLPTFVQNIEGPIKIKEEPEDGPRNMQKVPSLSDLSDQETSLGKFI